MFGQDVKKTYGLFMKVQSMYFSIVGERVNAVGITFFQCSHIVAIRGWSNCNSPSYYKTLIGVAWMKVFNQEMRHC